MLKTLSRLLFASALLISSMCSARAATLSRTKIVLDPSTFPKISRPLLQDTADQVARVVDDMIPGGYPSQTTPRILCFVAKGNWADKPRALVGKPWKIEPVQASKYTMRIAVAPEVLPGAWQRFVFQLSHELTHLKMDARVDNNVLESFAVAVSLETLHRLGYDVFRESNEKYYTQSIPAEVKAALSRKDWDSTGLYLRYAWRDEGHREWDQATHFVAAMAIRAIGFSWERLWNVGARTECGSEKANDRARYCPLSMAAFEDFPTALQQVFRRDPMRNVVMRISNTKPGDGFVFREDKRWVSLRWVRKIDSEVPEGYVPID